MKGFFRVFLGLIIVSLFLPPFVALPYTPQAAFYYPLWVVLVILFYPRIVLNTGFLASFSFLVLHVVYVLFDLYQTEKYSMLEYFWPIAFSFSVLEYFRLSKDSAGLKTLTRLSILLLIITSITSSISLTIFPSAARDMAGYLSETKQLDLGVFYMLIGIGNYYFYHNIAICVPIIVLLIQHNKTFRLKRWRMILLLVVVFFAVMRGAFSSAFGIFFIGLLFAFFLSRIRTVFSYIMVLVSFYLVFSLMGPLIAPGVYALADVVDSEFISPRLRNVGANLDGSAKFLSDEELRYTQGYDEQMSISMEAFKDRPLTGSGRQGGHHFWADILAKFGIIGLLPWLFIVVYLFRTRLSWFSGRFRVVALHTFFTLIFIGFFKPIGLDDMFSFIAIFVPAFLLYLQEMASNPKKISSLHPAQADAGKVRLPERRVSIT